MLNAKGWNMAGSGAFPKHDHERRRALSGKDVKSVLAAALRRLRPAAILLCLIGAMAAPPASAANGPTYLTSGELLQRALDALFAKISSTPKVSMISVEPAFITVLTQGTDALYQTDEWTISRFDYLWFDRDSVSGPAPHQSEGIVPQAENSFFDISEVNIGGLEDISARAMAYAKLWDAASITSLRIAREVHILPERTYGPVQWRMGLSSGRESATVYADGAGEITGGDLSGTIRAQRLDMLAQDDWPAEEAQAQLASVIGDRAIVHNVTVSPSDIGIRAEHPTSRNLLRDYIWNYSGVRPGLVDMPNILVSNGIGDIEPFSLSEIKLSALPAIKAAAKKAFASNSAVITGLTARKPTDRAGAPVIRWQVDFREPTGDRGHVDVSPTGEVFETILPKNRQPNGPWLAPATIVKTLKRIEKEFGQDARFAEISIDDERASVLVEESRNPGFMAHFIVDGVSITRFGPPQPWYRKANEVNDFGIEEIVALSEDRIKDFASRTLAAMNREGFLVYRWTISRRMTPKVEAPVLAIEVRAGTDQGRSGGWVVFAMDGAEHEIMTP